MLHMLRQAVQDRNDFEIYTSQGLKDATHFVRQRIGQGGDALRFYACGGDGTMQEVITAVADAPECEVACIPTGSSNDFLENFTNRTNFLALDRQLAGTVVELDLLEANGYRCLNLLNVGIDAEVCHYKEKFTQNRLVSGPMGYQLAIAYCFLKKFGQPLRVTLDGDVLEDNFLLCAFGNGTTYGGGYHATPLAVPNDGLIDACLIRTPPHFKALELLSLFQKGTHLQAPSYAPYLVYRQVRTVRVESSDLLKVCIDGEFFQSHTVDLSIRPGAIRFVLPQGSELRNASIAQPV